LIKRKIRLITLRTGEMKMNRKNLSAYLLDEEAEDPNDLEIESFKFDFDHKKKNHSLILLSITLFLRKNLLNSASS
jgi:hypothetical protein